MDAQTKTSFLQALAPLPDDPLLGLSTLFLNDPNPDKIDLGVGVYKDASGQAPVFPSVKQAEALWLQQEPSKSYTDPKGDAGYIGAMETLLLGEQHTALIADRVRTLQTPGGSCALRIAAEFIKRCNPQATIWLSNPTWVNHQPLLSRIGLEMREYRYYDYSANAVDFDSMISSLSAARAGDAVLLHGCCHNPSGADLSLSQWQAVVELVQQRHLMPLVDIAYQGIGQGLDEDAAGLRLLAAAVPEALVVASCSKNFALYRERVGSFSIIANSSRQADISLSQALDIIRGYYFVPPAHGSHVVKLILSDNTLRQTWRAELEQVRQRIQQMRKLLTTRFSAQGDGRRFAHILRQHGMFSFLGLTHNQVNYLRQEHSIYMAGSSRINVSGINADNVDYLVDSILTMLRQRKAA